MKSHNPTLHSYGYEVRRPLSNGLLEYLDGEDRLEYIRGHKTLDPEPATPPRIGFQVGEICVYVRQEDIERV